MRMVLLIGPALLFASGATAAEKPNVLMIAVDDLNCNLGCYGHPLVKTPNIDRLAARGVRFERAYCQYPLCNPSRTSILSGRRPDTTGITNNTTQPRKNLGEVVFLPEHFKANGYFTARVGKIAHGTFEGAVKWDLSEVPRRQNAQQQKADADQEKQPQPTGGVPISWKATTNDDAAEPDGRTARRIVELIAQHKDGSFFIAAGFHKPHLPFNSPKKYFDLYPPDKIPLPITPADERKKVPLPAFTFAKGDENLTAQQKQQAIAAYLACVSFTDAQVGLLLDALERNKLWDNTIVVFWGDHGFHLAEHGGMWRKMSLFEESARVPLIVATPRNKPAVSPRLVELVDLYPTLCDLCRLPKPEGLEGTSFTPLLENAQQDWKKAAFTQVARSGGGRSLRTERYRYTEWTLGDKDAGAQLYDHDKDPHEHVNLAQHPEHAGTVAELNKLLAAGWRAALPPSATNANP